MVTRIEVLSRAVEDCMKDLYSLVVPKISFEDFIKECKSYNTDYKNWENYKKAFNARKKHPEIWNQYKSTFKDWENKSIKECIGPEPFDFYYLPKEIMKDICDCYISAYRMDSQQELLNTIEILKNYCKEPIVDKYIEGELRKDGTRWPGHRGYEHPDNIYKEIAKIITKYSIEEATENSDDVIEICNKFFKFLDMAGNFYNWNGDLNSFNASVYLGASPSSNKEMVIENWKKYRNKDIEIDEEQIKKDYYGEED